MKVFFYICVLFTSFGLLSGCSSTSSQKTVGDAMLMEGMNAQELGKKWNEGNDLISKGEKMKLKGQEKIEDGYEEIDEGKALISKGNRLVSQGQEMMQESEATFKDKYPAKTLITE